MGQPSVILPYLLLGTTYHARNDALISRLGISHILNVKESARYPEQASYRYLHVPLSDYGDTELDEVLPQCFAFIDEAKNTGGKVLVHCRYGMNRSPTIVVSYLLVREGLTLLTALETVCARHYDASPHVRYLAQLVHLEKRDFRRESVDPKDLPSLIIEIYRRLAGTKQLT